MRRAHTSLCGLCLDIGRLKKPAPERMEAFLVGKDKKGWDNEVRGEQRRRPRCPTRGEEIEIVASCRGTGKKGAGNGAVPTGQREKHARGWQRTNDPRRATRQWELGEQGSSPR